MTGFECFALCCRTLILSEDPVKTEELLKDEVPPLRDLQMPAAPLGKRDSGQPLKSIFVRKINVREARLFSTGDRASDYTYENRNINMEEPGTIRVLSQSCTSQGIYELRRCSSRPDGGMASLLSNHRGKN